MHNNNLAENTAQKQRGRPFAKGVSGNPAGKPRGAINASSKIALALLDNQLEEITNTLIDIGLAGDISAIKLIFDKIVPNKKEISISLSIPKINTIKDVVEASCNIIDAVASSEITITEGIGLMSLIDNAKKIIELHEFEERLDNLEKKLGKD